MKLNLLDALPTPARSRSSARYSERYETPVPEAEGRGSSTFHLSWNQVDLRMGVTSTRAYNEAVRW
ncbi:hypothetical protein [Sorangium sp. So ce887]|uniref:hypothetical protein n=1 Tax=Sorangium sp. So ce887 TaxID=3133324 RepID=UPI003F6465F3